MDVGDDGFTTGFRLDLVQNNVASSPTTQDELVVLLATGSYCPVHTEHIRIFDVVRAHMTQQGKHVVGGFMCPSHDQYVQNKMERRVNSFHIPGYHRWKMIDLALSDSTWISSSSWELLQKGFVTENVTYRNLQKYLRENVDSRITVYYLCGADWAYNLGMYAKEHSMHIVCVGRPPYTDKLRQAMNQITNMKQCRFPFQLVEYELNDVSSTVIRESLQSGASIDEYCPPCVSEYMAIHNLVPQ